MEAVLYSHTYVTLEVLVPLSSLISWYLYYY